MKKLLSIAAGVAVASVIALGSGTAFADTFYSNIGGGNIFQSKNVTQNGEYNDPTTVACNETVRFRLYLHNAGPETADSVKVKVAFPGTTGTSSVVTATVTPSNADPRFATVSDTATVNSTSAVKLSYVAGSAEYFNNSGTRLGALNDSIVSTGADIPGGVGVSLNNAKYVALNAKATCETIVTPGDIQVCELATKKVITIKENQFDSSKHTTDLSKCAATPVTPKEIPNTGAGDVLALFAVVTIAGAIAHRVVLGRR